jgi:hypothetical protein
LGRGHIWRQPVCSQEFRSQALFFSYNTFDVFFCTLPVFSPCHCVGCVEYLRAHFVSYVSYLVTKKSLCKVSKVQGEQ